MQTKLPILQACLTVIPAEGFSNGTVCNSSIPGMKPGNLFADALPPAEGERFETLLKHRNLVVERIVSSSAISPVEYVQTQDEWVLLLEGEAVLEVAGERHELKRGDYLFLPAGVSHSVLSTSQGALWLALHLHDKHLHENS